MEIKDLEPRQSNVEVVATIKSIDEPREFEKFGNPGKVANATIEDESGSMKLTLWNEQIEKVKVGDKIHITNGYVNEWQGESQLTTGKFGQLEIVGDGEATETTEAPAKSAETEEVTEDSTEEPAGEEAADETAEETSEESTEEEKPETVEEEVVEESAEEPKEE